MSEKKNNALHLQKRGRQCAVDNRLPCDWDTLGSFDDLSGKVGEIEVVQCRRCGLGISLPPIPDVTFLYQGRGSQDFVQDGSRIGHAIKSVAFHFQAKTLLNQLPSRPMFVLDFGCGSGQFTRCLGNLLGEEKVSGSDFDVLPPRDLVDRTYVKSRELGNHSAKFDLVIAMHVLEHDDDPAALLDLIAAPAVAGGYIVIEVPNVDCFWAKIFDKSWDAWYVPYHRTHFSKASLLALVERAGYQVLETHNVCLPTMGRSLSNLVGGKKGLFWLLAGIATYPIQWIGEKVTGKPSALRVILRNPG